MISIYIVDDHPVSRWGLQRALESEPDVRVTGMFGSAGEVLASRRSSSPDLVLLDLYLADDLPAVPLASELVTWSTVVVVSASRRATDVEACRQAGVRGFLHKSSDASTLVTALRGCLRGEFHFPEAGQGCQPTHPLGRLSPRELEVLAYIAGGYTHDQTARRLGVSRHTVDTYLKRLRAKIGFGNKAHLTRMALTAGIRLDQLHEVR